MQPHIITDPPPNLTVPFTSLSLRPSPAFFQAHFLPSEPMQLILVSSDHITCFQSSTAQSWWLKAKSNLSLLWCLKRRGCFCFTTAFISAFFKWQWMVWGEMQWFLTSWRVWVVWTAFSAFPVPKSWIACHISVGEMMDEWPPVALERLGQCSVQMQLMVELLNPVEAEIWQVVWPNSMKAITWLIWLVKRDFMMKEVVKAMVFGCIYIMLNCLYITWPNADIISHDNIWTLHFNMIATKLFQWHEWLRMDISLQPLDQITWSKNWFVAKSLYFV